MSDVIVVARAKALAGQEKALEAALAACISPTHAEAGCVRYALHQGADDPGLYVMIERWTSRAALNAHLATPYVTKLFETLPRLVAAPPELLILDPLGLGVPEKAKI